MVRSRLGALLLLAILTLPQRAAAGGNEFPADGTRNLGRGGAGVASADDAYVMVRNPARLADLWGDTAMLGAHFLFVDACMRPTGGYGAGITRADVFDLGGEPAFLMPPAGATTLDGEPLVGFESEAYPTVCYEGPMPFLPHAALTMKLQRNLGVGIGFFPPDSAATNQWGNPDGTVDTPNGTRPNPLRYFRSHLNTSYFSLLGAVGYRPADWISFGFAFQWQLVVFNSRSWSTPVSGLTPTNDIRTDVFGRDLFIPGMVASVNLKPFDALDISAGFKWSDSINAKAKLDITTSALSLGEPFPFLDASGNEQALGSGIATTNPNQPGVVDSGPVWAPQLYAGVRFADRLKPKPKGEDWDKAKATAGGVVEDAMATERWSVEADVIYYFTSVFDRAAFTTPSAKARFQYVSADGTLEAPYTLYAGDCIEPNFEAAGEDCTKRLVKTDFMGKNQITFRAGGDYNVLPGLFAVRAGFSYETDGQDPQYLNIMQYMYGRMGFHGGATVRIAGKTDLSIGFAHFLQRDLRLQINKLSEGDFRLFKTDPDKYHFAPGLGINDAMAMGGDRQGPFDGSAGIEVGNSQSRELGPYFVNAGSYFYNLSVLSIEVTQHF
jgi:hypothetical protein